MTPSWKSNAWNRHAPVPAPGREASPPLKRNAEDEAEWEEAGEQVKGLKASKAMKIVSGLDPCKSLKMLCRQTGSGMTRKRVASSMRPTIRSSGTQTKLLSARLSCKRS